VLFVEIGGDIALAKRGCESKANKKDKKMQHFRTHFKQLKLDLI
jgi:hypothetical protein